MPVRIVIAEDQELVRQGVAALLQAIPDHVIVGEAVDGETAIEQVRALQPDIVLMDLSMPGLDGVAATKIIKREFPQTQVLILSVTASERRAAEAFAAGADGYALKKSGCQELATALEAVRNGQAYLGPGLDAQQVAEWVPARPGGLTKLSKRETQVLQLIAKGQKNRDIAEHLGIAVKTVETHRTKLMQKLDLHNSADLATYAMRHGLIE